MKEWELLQTKKLQFLYNVRVILGSTLLKTIITSICVTKDAWKVKTVQESVPNLVFSGVAREHKMGSLQHCCRLCAMAVPEDQQVRLANLSLSNRENIDNSLTSKLRFFLNLNVTPEDFSHITCTHCINSLEFCIQVTNSIKLDNF